MPLKYIYVNENIAFQFKSRVQEYCDAGLPVKQANNGSEDNIGQNLTQQDGRHFKLMLHNTHKKISLLSHQSVSFKASLFSFAMTIIVNSFIAIYAKTSENTPDKYNNKSMQPSLYTHGKVRNTFVC